MRILFPKSEQELKEWMEKMDTAGKPYSIESTKQGKVMKLDPNDAEVVLGQEPQKMPLTGKIFLVFIGLFILLFVILIATNTAPDPTEGMTVEEKERYELQQKVEENFGLTSEWFASYMNHVQQSVKHPRTMKIEGLRLYPIDQDSFTMVFQFSSENDFGVRMDNSITSVIEMNGELKRVVTFK